jgi:hypothetical protein
MRHASGQAPRWMLFDPNDRWLANGSAFGRALAGLRFAAPIV